MAFFDIPLLQMLSTRMAYTSERQAVLSQNLANIDTPGYRPNDLEPLTFKDMLVGGAQRLPMTATDATHITRPGGFTTQFNIIEQAQTFETKPVGNSVSLDDQMTQMAANQNDFQVSASLYQRMTAMLRQALGASG